nr:hypothetical protein [Mycoplasmopsis bovis]
MLSNTFTNSVIKSKVAWISTNEATPMGECKYLCGILNVIVGTPPIPYCKTAPSVPPPSAIY